MYTLKSPWKIWLDCELFRHSDWNFVKQSQNVCFVWCSMRDSNGSDHNMVVVTSDLYYIIYHTLCVTTDLNVSMWVVCLSDIQMRKNIMHQIEKHILSSVNSGRGSPCFDYVCHDNLVYLCLYDERACIWRMAKVSPTYTLNKHLSVLPY